MAFLCFVEMKVSVVNMVVSTKFTKYFLNILLKVNYMKYIFPQKVKLKTKLHSSVEKPYSKCL